MPAEPMVELPAGGELVRTSQLTRRFGAVTAVHDVSLAVHRGEIFGLIGPNGAGKSTLIKMLTTLLPPSSGQAMVAGFDVARQAQEVRRRIGYVPQLLSSDGELTGYENLLLSARLYLVPRAQRVERIEAALGMLGLSEVRNRRVREFSGGMIRRLEIAQSTLHRPRVLFLDEPTVGLDPAARRVVWNHIRELRRDLDAAVLLTTHHMDEAEELCDRVAVLHAGGLLVCGSPAELRSATGPQATLDDVFVTLTGTSLRPEGDWGDIRRSRRSSLEHA